MEERDEYNTHPCEHCKTIIDYEKIDVCPSCGISIFLSPEDIKLEEAYRRGRADEQTAMVQYIKDYNGADNNVLNKALWDLIILWSSAINK